MKYVLITLALLTASVTHASDYLSLSCNLVTNKGAEMPMTAKLDLLPTAAGAWCIRIHRVSPY